MTRKKFLLTRETIAIGLIDGKRVAVQIPGNSEIRVLPHYGGKDLMVEVVWEGQPFVMFVADLQSRGIEVKGDAVGA